MSSLLNKLNALRQEQNSRQGIMKALNINEFKKWCSRYSSGTVGQSLSAKSCPLASYLYDQGLNVKVGPRELKELKTERVFSLPEWACEFVKIVDQGPRRSVRGYEARHIIEMVEHRLNKKRFRDLVYKTKANEIVIIQDEVAPTNSKKEMELV